MLLIKINIHDKEKKMSLTDPDAKHTIHSGCKV